jgi:hypothetical protein
MVRDVFTHPSHSKCKHGHSENALLLNLAIGALVLCSLIEYGTIVEHGYSEVIEYSSMFGLIHSINTNSRAAKSFGPGLRGSSGGKIANKANAGGNSPDTLLSGPTPYSVGEKLNLVFLRQGHKNFVRFYSVQDHSIKNVRRESDLKWPDAVVIAQ